MTATETREGVVARDDQRQGPAEGQRSGSRAGASPRTAARTTTRTSKAKKDQSPPAKRAGAEVRDFPDGPPDDPGLTPRQRRVLEVIRDSVERRGYPPSMREIGEAV